MNEGVIQQFLTSIFGQNWRTSLYGLLAFLAAAADLIQTYMVDMGFSQPAVRSVALFFGLLALWNAKDRGVSGVAKVIAIFFLALALLNPAPAFAASKPVTFAWEQAAADTALPTFGGWKIYQKVGSGATAVYTLVATINFVSSQTTYTSSQTITVPDGSAGSRVYVATAFKTTGEESAYSNEATMTWDFVPPSVPIQFRIQVVTQ